MEMKFEEYKLGPTPHVPNSRLPVIIYRDVLPHPRNEDTVTEFLTRHKAWEKRGTWGHIGTRHFHPNTHECYGVFQGDSELLLGVGPTDDDSQGLRISVSTGDVILLPAGTGHSSSQSSKDYRYIGVYPTEAPRWRSEWGKTPLVGDTMLQEIELVGPPSADPVTGEAQPLLDLWKAAVANAAQDKAATVYVNEE